MFIPQFSLKRLLFYVMIAGVLSLLLSIAVRGNLAAIAVVVSIASILFTMFIYSFTFFFGWVVTSVFRRKRPTSTGASPFASAHPPPQIIPPRAPD